MARDISLCEDACYGPRKFLEKRDIPRINGSSGAFIAIIVCLVIIIIAAWGGILFLRFFRDESASDVEQARHSQRDQPLTTPYSSDTDARPTWGSRITTFFGRAGHKNASNDQQREKWRAWVHSGSTDNRETKSSVPGRFDMPDSAGLSSSQGTRSSSISRSTSSSLSSVSSDHLDLHGMRYLSPSQTILPSIESQLSSPSISSSQSSNTYVHTLSSVPQVEPIPINLRFDDDSREYVGSSGMIMRTLPGGSKFLEQL